MSHFRPVQVFWPNVGFILGYGMNHQVYITVLQNTKHHILNNYSLQTGGRYMQLELISVLNRSPLCIRYCNAVPFQWLCAFLIDLYKFAAVTWEIGVRRPVIGLVHLDGSPVTGKALPNAVYTALGRSLQCYIDSCQSRLSQPSFVFSWILLLWTWEWLLLASDQCSVQLCRVRDAAWQTTLVNRVIEKAGLPLVGRWDIHLHNAPCISHTTHLHNVKGTDSRFRIT